MRVGIDLGGTKIESALMDSNGALIGRLRIATPPDYQRLLIALAEGVEESEKAAGAKGTVIGIAMPGSLSPKTGLVRNANSVWLNGMALKQDLERVLGRPVRIENDANCFALSEATDGAGAGAKVVFGVILGTGCGGGVVVDGRTIEGANGIAGEWGHVPLPWPRPDELPFERDWCGKYGCLETWISGSGLARWGSRTLGEKLRAEEIVARSRAGDQAARAVMDDYANKVARAFAMVMDLLDPDVIVLGGGMSNVEEIYPAIWKHLPPYVFSDVIETKIVRNLHGDSSGIRGAAWLWRADEA